MPHHLGMDAIGIAILGGTRWHAMLRVINWAIFSVDVVGLVCVPFDDSVGEGQDLALLYKE